MLTVHFLAISREPRPLGRPQQRQELGGTQKIRLPEDLPRLPRLPLTFLSFRESCGRQARIA
jgi:hypothetical protein